MPSSGTPLQSLSLPSQISGAPTYVLGSESSQSSLQAWPSPSPSILSCRQPAFASQLSVVHASPSSHTSGTLSEHTCVVTSQVGAPLQTSPSSQSASLLQLNVQSLSQPSPSMPLPSSHSSPLVTILLPQ